MDGPLDQRLQLETRRHELHAEARAPGDGWRRTGLTGLAILGLTGAFLIIVLPIRYRIHANRELIKVRERIAGDLHDEVGSNLGSIQMFADLAEGRSGPSDELKRIQRIAAETVSAVRDIVWLLRPQGDHRIGTVEHLRETSSIMLESAEMEIFRQRGGVAGRTARRGDAPLVPVFSRGAAQHFPPCQGRESGHPGGNDRRPVPAHDLGRWGGHRPERLERPATLRALRQRAEALDANFMSTAVRAEGTRLTLTVPLDRSALRKSRSPRGARRRTVNLRFPEAPVDALFNSIHGPLPASPPRRNRSGWF